MEDLKMIIAGNIGALRRESGMTQLQLAEALNYSDKAVSKWERGEAVPDIGTLKQIADLYAVSVDYLLRPDHPVETDIRREYTKHQRRNHILITVMACVAVWFIAAFLYTSMDVALPAARPRLWPVFVYSVPLSLIVLLVFNSIWGNRRFNFAVISLLIWSALASIYLSAWLFAGHSIWMVFIIGVPAQVIVFLWSGLRYPKPRL